jgi:two-component system chemotaxis sensor kinase CheA
MDSFDDETLQSFVEASRAYLADIETDLLTLEADGIDVEEERIDKVFRAAHGIKGGAGFMGLDTIKNLAHQTEIVLGMIRSGQIDPTSEVVNILRLSFDKLRDMIHTVNDSNKEDVTEYTVALAGITSAFLSPEDKHAVHENVEISLPSGQTVFTVSRLDIQWARKEQRVVLLVEFDLIHDIHRHGLTPLTFLKQLEEQVAIIDCTVDIGDVGCLDDEGLIDRLPLYVLMSSDVLPDNAAALFGVTPGQVHCLAEDLTLKTVDMAGFEIITPPAGVMEAAPVKSPESAVEPEPEAHINSPEASVPEPVKAVASRIPQAFPKVPPGMPEANLRVSVKLLDTLMNLAGELVLSRNALIQASAGDDSNQLDAAIQRIDLVTSELQEAIISTRMRVDLLKNLIGD